MAAFARETIVTKSHVDGSPANAFFIAPTKPTEHGKSTLVVYSHGMLSSIEEPFVVPPGAPTGPVLTSIYPNYGFLSVGVPESWADPRVLQDFTDAITTVQNKHHFERIIYMGASMGGCNLLRYIELAPPEIKEKSECILTLVSCGDLAALYKTSLDEDVKRSIAKALHGTPVENKDEYKARSFIANIKEFPADIKVVILSNNEDSTVPPKLQTQLYRALIANKNQVKLFQRKGNHTTWPPPVMMQYYIDHIIHKRLM